MYILFTDETNNRPSDAVKFFICGGLFFPLDALLKIDQGIAQIRHAAGYLPKDSLKFDTRSRPPQVTMAAATEAKSKVIDLCLENKCRFIALVIHHKIVANKGDNQFLWAMDAIIAKFNQVMRDEMSHGICIMDTLPVEQGQWKYFSDKFCAGLHFDGKDDQPLARIRLFAATCNNASYISSAVDIVLGTFRYCVNNPKNLDAAQKMMKNVVGMMHKKIDGNTIFLREFGLLFRPQTVRIAEYKQAYDDLVVHLTVLLKT